MPMPPHRLAHASAVVVAALALAAITLRPMNRLFGEIKIPSGATPSHDGPYLPARMADSVSVGSRDLPIDIWYPRAATFVDGRDAGKAWSPRGLRHASPVEYILVRLGVADDATPTASPEKFPLLILASGWNGNRHANRVLSAALASAGYIVVAIDDVGGDPDASGEAAVDFDFSSEAGFAGSWAVAERRLALMTDRVSGFITGLLARSAPGSSWRLAGRIDPDAIGVLGFSFGGTVAAETPHTDKRIKAVANLDGWLMGRAETDGVAAPYLSFGSDFPGLENATHSWSTGRRVAASTTLKDRRILSRLAKSPDTFALILKGTQHSDFADDLFEPALRTYVRSPWGLWREGQLRIHALRVSLLLAFFDRYLRHAETPKLLTERPSRNPEVLWIEPQ